MYVVYDGFSYTLDLRAQAQTLYMTKICLEPNVLDSLNMFRERMNKMSHEELMAIAKDVEDKVMEVVEISRDDLQSMKDKI